jgi:hypothetical protein
MKSPKFIMPVQSFAFGGIANPAQSAYLSSADKAYLGEQQQKLDAFEQQRLAYNDALTAWQEKQYNPYVTQAEAYNAAAKKYNDEVYSPYQSAYDEYTKAVADWNAGSRTADYAGPSMPTLASTFDMVAPKEPGAFDMVAPEVPFKEEEIAAYQQAAGRRAQDSAAKRAVAIDVVSDPERFNFGSMSISNRFMAEGGEVKDKRSARAMLDEVDGADDDAAVLRMVGELKSGGKLSDDEIMQAVDMIAAQGRGGDELLAFLSPESVVALKRMGGSGTINPVTGLPEFKGSPVKKAINSVKKALGLQKEPAPAAAAPVATSSLIGAKPVAPPVVAEPVAPPVVAAPVAPPTAKEDLEKIAAPKEKPSVRPSLLEEGWKAPEGAASMALVTWYNKDSGESRTVPTGGWTPPSGSWSTTPPQAGTVPAPKVAPVPVKQPPVVAKPVAPPVVAKPVAPPVVAEPVAFPVAPPTAKEDLEKIAAPIPAPEPPPPPPPVARDRMDVPGMIRSMPGSPISVMPGTVQPGPDAYRGVSPIDYRSFLSTNTPVASPISNFRQPATFEGGLSRPTVRRGLSPVVVPTAGSEPVSRESSSAYQPTFNLAQQYGNVTNPQNYFSMVPGSSTGISPGTSAIGSPDMPISSARNTLNALNNNKNLSPTMLGGAENAGYMVDRLGNMIYSPGAFQPTRSFKEGGAANADEVDTPINTDPLGTAQQFLSQLLGSSSKAAAPTLKSVKRKTASGGAKKSDEMVMGYEAGAKEAASKDSARAQMEELARLYKEKAVQAADVSRGFGKNTFGAPTLAGRTLTKNTLAKKRFAEGGEAKKSEGDSASKVTGINKVLDFIAQRLPADVFPTTGRTLLETVQGVKTPITEENFSPEEMGVMRDLATRKGGDKGSINYADYVALAEEINKKDKASASASPSLFSMADPMGNVQTTLGQFSYIKDPEGNLQVVDTYDFNPPNPNAMQEARTGDYGAFGPYGLIRDYAGEKVPPGAGREVRVNLGPAERAKGSPEEGEVKDKYETFKSNFADYKTLDPRAVEEAAFISKNLTVKTDPDNPGSTIPNKPRDQLGRAGQELLDFLEKTGKMPTVVESRRFPGNSYEGPSFQYMGLNDEDTGVVRFPSFKKDPYGSLVHELTHASDRAMLLGRSDLLKRLKKGEEISPEDQRFLDGYMKLYKESTKLPLNISDDDLTDSDKKYRTSRNELRAFGAGNMAQDPPEAGRYTQQDVGETLNPHVDPTMATEAAIMRELYLRSGKKSKK